MSDEPLVSLVEAPRVPWWADRQLPACSHDYRTIEVFSPISESVRGPRYRACVICGERGLDLPQFNRSYPHIFWPGGVLILDLK